MRRFSPRAFTLVELLVVIGIIGMLVALLLPAVLSGRAQAEQTKCQNQMKEWAAAALQHAMRKGRFPGYAETFNVSGGTENVGWVPTLFPYMDMQDRYRQLLEQTTDTFPDSETNGDDDLLWTSFLDILVCPSDPPDLSADNSASFRVEIPTSYAVNAGRRDTGDPPDTAQFAVFHDRRNSVTTKVSVSLDDLSDGKRATMLISENVDLGDYHTTTNEPYQGLVCEDFVSGNGDPVDCRVPTQEFYNTGLLATPDDLDYEHARPSSFHQEGFNIAYADGSVEFFFVDPTADVPPEAILGAKMTPGNRD